MKKTILNKKFKTVKVKWSKEYVEVKERVLALAEDDIRYSIETEYEYFDERKMWVVKAKLTMLDTWEVYTWLAQELESAVTSSVNFTSALENAETSAVWRACAFAWIGTMNWIASADEVVKAVNRWSAFAESEKPWYNDFDKVQAKWKDLIDKWEKTPEEIIKTLESAFRVSKETKAKIMEL